MDTDNIDTDNIDTDNTIDYNNDPSDSQIESATKGIILNDITEPRDLEQTYDNTDIINTTEKFK